MVEDYERVWKTAKFVGVTSYNTLGGVVGSWDDSGERVALLTADELLSESTFKRFRMFRVAGSGPGDIDWGLVGTILDFLLSDYENYDSDHTAWQSSSIQLQNEKTKLVGDCCG